MKEQVEKIRNQINDLKSSLREIKIDQLFTSDPKLLNDFQGIQADIEDAIKKGEQEIGRYKS